MAIALPDKWLWDSWYHFDGTRWHSYFLQADKSLDNPEARHWNVSYGHAISQDLVNWTHLGTCFAPSATPAWDDCTTWTGSVVQTGPNYWHLFYTGTSHRETGLTQRIGHATSTDGHNWQRVPHSCGAGFCLTLNDDPRYEHSKQDFWPDRAMRDPWVMPNPDGGWLMVFTARAPTDGEANDGGAIGLATSPDLFTWTLQAPIFQGGFGQLEVPQIFHHKGRWYCLFCTAANHWSETYTRQSGLTPVTGSHYLIADHPHGPWQIAPGPFLDGSLPNERYAARILQKDGELVLLGFLDGRPKTSFTGEICDPVPITVDAGGLLHLTTSPKDGTHG